MPSYVGNSVPVGRKAICFGPRDNTTVTNPAPHHSARTSIRRMEGPRTVISNPTVYQYHDLLQVGSKKYSMESHIYAWDSFSTCVVVTTTLYAYRTRSRFLC